MGDVLYPSIIGLGGKFRLFRPYILGVCTTWVADSEQSLDGLTWKVTGVYTGITTYQQVTFKEEFFEPNTNVYSVDWILDEYFYVNVPGPHLATLPLNPQIRLKPDTQDAYLSLDSLGFPDWYFLDLPFSQTDWP